MSIRLTHVGEIVVQKMIEARQKQFFKMCGMKQHRIYGGSAFTEVQLEDLQNRSFDGGSKIDVILPISARFALPIELKLGQTGLSRSTISEWLNDCPITHNDKRWGGTMMAVLDRRFPKEVESANLSTRGAAGRFRLTKKWVLVVRSEIKKSLDTRPSLFRNAKVLDFDNFLQRFKKDEFDRLVGELMPQSFFETWFRGIG